MLKALALLLLALLALAFSLSQGSLDIPTSQLLSALWNDDGSLAARILHDLRLPRTFAAFAVGGLLALSGALIQVLLRNPLGDPYVLGISGGAALAVLLAMLLGVPLAWQSPLAFAGALLSMLLVLALSKPGQGEGSTLLLTGILVAAGWSALISFVLSLSPPVQLPGMLFWLMGDLGGSQSPAPALWALVLGLGIALCLAPRLNVLALGELRAQALGLNTSRLHMQLYLLASVLTAFAVTLAGAVGFVGLMAPHLARLLLGNDQRLLLPGATLVGGSLLVVADTVARTLISPQQLPVGVFTALIGVPFFVLLLKLKPGRQP